MFSSSPLPISWFPMSDTAAKRCLWCSAMLEKSYFESKRQFRQRKFCNRTCAYEKRKHDTTVRKQKVLLESRTRKEAARRLRIPEKLLKRAARRAGIELPAKLRSK